MRRPCLICLLVILAAAPLRAGDVTPLSRGSKEIGLDGIVYVSHDSPQDLFGVATGRFGYYVAGNHQVGVDATLFAYSRIQDLYLSGDYRYVMAKSERKWAPFFGAGAGANVSHFDFFGSQHSLIAKGEAGLRVFMGRRFALDIAYNLMYREHTDFGFTGTTSSILMFGFSKVF